jgi:hypothetical protein
MKVIIHICIIACSLLLLNSCKKEGSDLNLPRVSEYSLESMFYPATIKPDTTKIKLTYNKKNKISHRIGNLISINPATGYLYKFYEYVADTVMYYNDSIIIEKHLTSNEDFAEMDSYKRKLFLENGQIVKEIHKMDYYSYDTDTILYYYNEQNQIDHSVSLKSSTREYSKYKYDDNGNLNIVTSEIYKTDYKGNLNIIYNDTAWFQDYDNSTNSIKDLIIFQECFYRALSTNNFKKYLYKRYRNSDSILVLTKERTWEFTYDENNYPIY